MLLLAASAPTLTAQDTENSAAAEAVASSLPLCRGGTVPALTVVKLKTDAAVGSKISKTGEKFAMHLAEPVMLGDCVAISAGAAAEGEVIQAKKSGLMGAAGEFVGAARWLDTGSSRVRLRSLKMTGTGRDYVGEGGAASGAGVPFPRLFGGKDAELLYPAGYIVEAKLADAFIIAAPASTQPAEEVQ